MVDVRCAGAPDAGATGDFRHFKDEVISRLDPDEVQALLDGREAIGFASYDELLASQLAGLP